VLLGRLRKTYNIHLFQMSSDGLSIKLETDNNAALAAAAKVVPNSLLNYLSTPS